jgi:hypothetical protein
MQVLIAGAELCLSQAMLSQILTGMDLDQMVKASLPSKQQLY